MCSKSSSLISPFKKYSILIGSKGPVKPRIPLLNFLFSYTSSPTSFPGLIPRKTICEGKALKATISDKSLGTPSHFCIICQGIYQFVPFPPVQ